MATKEQRREIYRFYRSQGFTANQARNKRNAPIKALEYWQSKHNELKESGKKGIPFPSKVISDNNLKSIRQEIAQFTGKKTAYNLTRTKKQAYFNRKRVKGLYNAFGKKLTKKQFKEQLDKAQNKNISDFWDMASSQYKKFMGLADVKSTIRIIDNRTTGKKKLRKKKKFKKRSI